MESLERMLCLQPRPPAPLEDSEDEEEFCESCCEFGHNLLCCPLKYAFRRMMKAEMVNKRKVQAELTCQRMKFREKVLELKKSAEATRIMEKIAEVYPVDYSAIQDDKKAILDNDKIKFCSEIMNKYSSFSISLKQADFMFHTNNLVRLTNLHRAIEYFSGKYLLGTSSILKYFYYHMKVVLNMLNELGFEKRNSIICLLDSPVVEESDNTAKNFTECKEKIHFSQIDDYNLEKLTYENSRDHLYDFYTAHYVQIHVNLMNTVERLLRLWTQERNDCLQDGILSVDPEDYFSCLPNRTAINNIADDEVAFYKDVLIDTIFFVCCHSCLNKESALLIMDGEQFQEKFIMVLSRETRIFDMFDTRLAPDRQVAYDSCVSQRLERLKVFNKISSWLNKVLLNICTLLISDVLTLSDPIMRYSFTLFSASREKLMAITRKDNNFKLELPEYYMLHLVAIRRKLSYLEKSADRIKYIIPENDCSDLDMVMQNEKKKADLYNLLRAEVLYKTYKHTWGVFLVLYDHWKSKTSRKAATLDTMIWWNIGEIQYCKEALQNLETLVLDCRLDLDPNMHRIAEEDANLYLRERFDTLATAYKRASELPKDHVTFKSGSLGGPDESENDMSRGSVEQKSVRWIDEGDDYCAIGPVAASRARCRMSKDERIKLYLDETTNPCGKSLRNKGPSGCCEERL